MLEIRVNSLVRWLSQELEEKGLITSYEDSLQDGIIYLKHKGLICYMIVCNVNKKTRKRLTLDILKMERSVFEHRGSITIPCSTKNVKRFFSNIISLPELENKRKSVLEITKMYYFKI